MENELRKGNLVKGIGHEIVWTVEGVHDRFIFTGNAWRIIESFEPIPLTKDWLVRMGFTESNLDGDNKWLRLKYRFLTFESDESVNFKKVYLKINKMDIIVESVHELMNLYFVMTGKEIVFH
jgi:hypothetical protein